MKLKLLLLAFMPLAFAAEGEQSDTPYYAGPHSPDIHVYDNDPNPDFWIFRANGTTVINAKTKEVTHHIEIPAIVDGVVLEPLTGNSAWGDSIDVPEEGHIYINDRINNFVHVFDTENYEYFTGFKLLGTRPVHMYYIPQMHEIWTHTDGEGTFDVIHCDQMEITHEQVDATWAQDTGHGKIVFDPATMPYGYATATTEGRVMKIDLTTKQLVGEIDLNTTFDGEEYECEGTHYIGYSKINNRLWIQCSRPYPSKTYEVDVETEEVVNVWSGVSGGIHVSPDTEKFVAVSTGGERMCAYPGYGPPLDDCQIDEVIYPDGTLTFFTPDADDQTEIQMHFDVEGGPSHCIWVEKADSSGYYWSVWAMVSSDSLWVWDMEKIANKEDQTPSKIYTGTMLQEGHGSRYLDVGGGYIVSQSNADGAVSIVDISDSDCLGRGDCPVTLPKHEKFYTARNVMYAYPVDIEAELAALESSEDIDLVYLIAIPIACFLICSIGLACWFYRFKLVTIFFGQLQDEENRNVSAV